MIKLIGKQKGFTLVGLVVVIGLLGIIAAACTVAIHQVFIGTTLSNDLNTAVTQVCNAGYWISRDAQMAKPDTMVVNNNPAEQELLELTIWEDATGSTTHTVTYTLQNGELWRDYDGEQTASARIAQCIKPKGEGTDCHWDEVERMLTVTFTAQVEDETETRTFQVRPRPAPVS